MQPYTNHAESKILHPASRFLQKSPTKAENQVSLEQETKKTPAKVKVAKREAQFQE